MKGSRRRVVVIAGPSGSGKSRLTARLHAEHGWPIFRLDDFYKDGDDPSLPRHPSLALPDWDHPDSWDKTAALESLTRLVDEGESLLPVYDLGQSRATGVHSLSAGEADLILAEGIFAAEIINDLQREGLLHSAWCVWHRPIVNFIRRLSRDLKERRKPPLTLIRRGLALMRDETDVVGRQQALGAHCAHPRRIEQSLTAGPAVVR